MDKKLEAIIAIISDFVDVDPAEVTVETFKGKERGGMNFDSKCQGIEE